MVIKKKALITGATGFIGSNLVDYLLDENWQVCCLLRSSSKIENLSEKARKETFIYYLEDDNANISLLLREINPDVVFHLAGLTIEQHLQVDIRRLIESNITFGVQLVEAMVENKIKSFVNTGTSWQHYQNSTYSPTCLYAATKEAFYKILKFYQETADLKVITLKLFGTYGKNDNRNKIFSLIKEASETQKIIKMTPGEQLVNMVHIKDVVKCYNIAAKYLINDNSEYFGEYAVSSDENYKLKDFVKLYEKISKRKINVIWGGLDYRPREVMIPWNTGNILPGWKAYISMENGIKETLE